MRWNGIWTGLRVVAVAVLGYALWLNFARIDFELAENRKKDDLLLRDYVISHDFEFVKDELIELHKAQWLQHVDSSHRSRDTALLLGFVLLVLLGETLRGIGKKSAKGP